MPSARETRYAKNQKHVFVNGILETNKPASWYCAGATHSRISQCHRVSRTEFTTLMSYLDNRI